MNGGTKQVGVSTNNTNNVDEPSTEKMQAAIDSMSSYEKAFRISVWFANYQQLSVTLLVDIVVWAILYPPHAPSTTGFFAWDDVNMHILNAVLVYVDFALGRQPFEFHLLSFVLVIMTLYSFGSWCVYVLWHFWTYSFINTAIPFDAVMYFVVALMHLLLWYVVRYLQILRDVRFHPWILNRHTVAVEPSKEIPSK